jgi:hypothetical protein
MAVILNLTYSKKLGLPNFSSHQCSVSIQSEIADLSQVTGEVKRLYLLTQDAVDREIQEVGFLPDGTTYGMNPPANGNNGASRNRETNGREADTGTWACSPKQRELVEKIVRENDLDKHDIESLAQDRFGVGVRQLNRLQTSGLIDELLERHGGQRRNGNGNGQRGRFQREGRGASR